MRNIEVKARCADLELARERVERLGARPLGATRQRDTFFAAPGGRLKLRVGDDGRGELIAYRRPDHAAPRASDYRIYPTAEPALLHAVLADALGEIGVVEKRRRVWLHGRTRIHLDEVAGLGAFVELETVLEGQPEDDARAELAQVAAALDLDAADLVAGAYVDLRT
jgi:predicted adenylyl cyclase CyaB